MTIPMPRQLRVFDHVEDQYRIWAIVRYMKASIVEKLTVFDVGVAFIGKRAPASYEKEPWKRYDISTSAFQALAAADDILTPLPSTINEPTHVTTSRSICEWSWSTQWRSGHE